MSDRVFPSPTSTASGQHRKWPLAWENTHTVARCHVEREGGGGGEGEEGRKGGGRRVNGEIDGEGLKK